MAKLYSVVVQTGKPWEWTWEEVDKVGLDRAIECKNKGAKIFDGEHELYWNELDCPYVVSYCEVIDNGYEYKLYARQYGCKNHYEAIRKAKIIFREENIEDVRVIYSSDGEVFYYPGFGYEYSINEQDSFNIDETVVDGPLSFIDALSELIRREWNKEHLWTKYRIVAHRKIEPLPGFTEIDTDELPF